MCRTTPTINLVVNCTARKTVEPHPNAQVRNLKQGSLPQRLTSWVKGLAIENSLNKLPARNLYCGDGWSRILAAVNNHQNDRKVILWIASAGLGLVSDKEEVVPYSATFTSDSPDSLKTGQTTGDNQQWWNALTIWAQMYKRSPGSLKMLAKHNPSNPILMGLSPEYLKALSNDILAARDELDNPDSLVIVSIGTKDAGDLAENLLPAKANLEHLLGGVRSSLNARAVAYILNNFNPDQISGSVLRPAFEELVKELPPALHLKRAKLSDAALRKLIEEALLEDKKMSATKLLRRLRDSGRACEYNRFCTLFSETRLQKLKCL